MHREPKQINRSLTSALADTRLSAIESLAGHDPGPRRRWHRGIHGYTTAPLIGVMREDWDVDVRAGAAVALSGYTDEVATAAVRSELSRAAHDLAGHVIALALLGHASAAEDLVRPALGVLLREDASAFEGVEPSTADLLIELVIDGARVPPPDGLGLRRSRMTFGDPARAAAAVRLRDAGDPRAASVLAAAIVESPAREDAWTALFVGFDKVSRGRRRPGWLTGTAERIVPDRDDPLVVVLASLGASAFEAVSEVARGRELSVPALERIAAVFAIVGERDPSVLDRAFATDDPSLVEAAAAAVSRTSPPRLVPALISAALAPSARTRATAVAALGAILARPDLPIEAYVPAVGTLFDALVDDARTVRREAGDMLVRAARVYPDAFSAFDGLLRGYPETAARVAPDLIDAEPVRWALGDALRDAPLEVRRYALIAVRDAARQADAFSPLHEAPLLTARVSEAEKDPDEEVRRLAREATYALATMPVPMIAAPSMPAPREPAGPGPPRSAPAAGGSIGAYGPPLATRRRRRRAWRLSPSAFLRRARERPSALAGPAFEYDEDIEGFDTELALHPAGMTPVQLLWENRASPTRSLDVTVHTDDPSPQVVAEDAPLRQGVWYRLEVAVRGRVTGVPMADGEERRALPELPADEAMATLLVAVDSDDFELDDPLARILLPAAGGDSIESAWLRIRPRTATGDEPARLELRVYYAYNLVEVMRLEALVIPRLGGEGRSVAEHPLVLRHVSRERDLDQLGAVRPRAMNIGVGRRGDRYVLTFAFATEQGDAVMSGLTRVTADELDSALVTIRETWRNIALASPFIDAIATDQTTALAALTALAEGGRRLWSMLFRQQAGSGLTRIGELMRRCPLPDGATIQVSVEGDAGTFVFPWALLYDGPRWQNGGTPDAHHFWGARYIIEHGIPGVTRGPDLVHSSPSSDGEAPAGRPPSLEVAYMLWDRFENHVKHTQMLEALAQAAAGRLRIGLPPVGEADTCFALLEAGTSDLLYFYTHGFTRRRGAALVVTEELDRLKRWYEELDELDPRRTSLQPLYETLVGGAPIDRSYISFRYSRLYLDDLYADIDHLPRSPVVLLNMCESAQISPTLSDSFVHFFLDRGARAVVGTECPMTIAFAHPFAQELLERLFRGAELGEALLATRRAFIERDGNPLGLAYSLYGSATAGFSPPALAAGLAQPDTEGIHA